MSNYQIFISHFICYLSKPPTAVPEKKGERSFQAQRERERVNMFGKRCSPQNYKHRCLGGKPLAMIYSYFFRTALDCHFHFNFVMRIITYEFEICRHKGIYVLFLRINFQNLQEKHESVNVQKTNAKNN
uniref:Bifunctional dihydrofolate reductase-thymidylate synthase-like n=1 Tax=Rhizophora mucronata TaxID=61149 RepID=A0A2P2LQ89_RHIMU